MSRDMSNGNAGRQAQALRRKASAFLKLGPRRQSLVVHASVALVHAMLRQRHLVQEFRHPPRVVNEETPDRQWSAILERAWALQLLLKISPTRTPCLTFASALSSWTRAYAPQICFGVAGSRDALETHAWVEYPSLGRRLEVGGEGVAWKSLHPTR